MYKVRVFIYSDYHEERSFSGDVFVDIEIAAPPRVGDMLELTQSQYDHIANLILRDSETMLSHLERISTKYWDKTPDKIPFDDIDLINCIWVVLVGYNSGSDMIRIELHDEPTTK